MTSPQILKFKTQQQAYAKQAFAIREIVFVKEQQVDPKEEYDEFEDESIHFLAFLDGKPIGTARWRETDKGYKLERFAVLKEYRSKGAGGKILEEVLKDVPAGKIIYLHAQLPAVTFYERHGFYKVGEIFEEAGILHYKMLLKNK